MDAAAAAPQPRHFPATSMGLVRLIVAGCVVAALGWAAYYGLGVLRSTAFNNDRAFRVLNEIAAQLDNFQGTMVSLIRLIPESAECRGTPNCDAWRRYTSKLNVPEIELSHVDGDLTGKSGKVTFVRSCKRGAEDVRAAGHKGLEARYELRLWLDDPGRRFTVYPCGWTEWASGVPLLSGRLQSSLPRFVSQGFFDEALLTLHDGTALATIPSAGSHPETPQVELYAANGDGLIVANAQELLRAAAHADVNVDHPVRGDGKTQGPPASDGVVRHPVVFDKTIAGTKYRVFVLPFQPSVPWYVQGAASEQGMKTISGLRHEKLLYIVGLKQARLTRQVTYELWPDGTFLITVISLLIILAWPLLRLKLSAPLEPISRTTAFSAVASFLLIAGVLVISAIWIWSRMLLINWADVGAKRYADQIHAYLVQELQDTTGLLEHYRDALYSEYRGDPCSTILAQAPIVPQLPVRLSGAAPYRASVPLQTGQHECQMQYLWRATTDADDLGTWSPLRTVVALNQDGKSYGPRLTAFGEVPQRLKLNLQDREYFRALAGREAWRPEVRRPGRNAAAQPLQANALSKPARNKWTKVPDQGFVAQRLFSRGDAARVLQIAVPRYGDQGEFFGAVTGDSRVYGLTAGVSPLMLRFAVVDAASGTVLFHSDDRRSLVENFFVETEQDPELRARLMRRVPARNSRQPWLEDLSSGRYLSEPHRFYVHPVGGMPWRIVVFYSTKDLGDIAFQAGVAALVAFVTIAACLALLVLLVVRRTRRWLWPHWKRAPVYRQLAWGGIGAAIAIGALSVWAMGYGMRGPAAALAFSFVPFGVAVYHRRRASAIAGDTRRLAGGERHYVVCVVLAAVLVSALPAIYLAVRFHDLSVQTFVRDGLFTGAQQIERRRALIADDLRRWEPNARMRQQRYPDAWALADALKVPGIEAQPPTKDSGHKVTVWTLAAFDRLPWMDRAGPVDERSWLSLLWSVTRSSPVPQRSSSPRTVEREEPQDLQPKPDASGLASEQPPEPTAGKDQVKEPPKLVEPYFQRGYDQHRIRLLAPYAGSSLGASVPAIVQHGTVLLLGAATLLVVFWLSFTVSRRLLGSKTVFLYGPQTGQLADVQRTGSDVNAIWKSLRQEDQLFLHQLAQNRVINPANEGSLKRLSEAGLIAFDPWPKIADPAFKQHADTAEEEALFDTWQRKASESLWNTIRTPLLVLMLIVVAFFLYLSNTTMQIVTTVLAGLASVLGYLSQAQNFLRGNGSKG